MSENFSKNSLRQTRELSALQREVLQSQSQRIDARFADAKVKLDPYPHLIMDGVLDPDEIDICLRNWPSGKTMSPEPGGLNRRWTELCVQNRFTDPAVKTGGGFWVDFFNHTLEPIYANIARIFMPFIRSKLLNELLYLFYSQLTLLQADDDFVLHGVHTHYAIGPQWLFTVLIYLDDDDAINRGTRLYGIEQLSSVLDGSLLERLEIVANRFKPFPSVDTGFLPGRILAFFEGPLALHGSTPFKLDRKLGKRKMIRLHATAPQEDLVRAYGAPNGSEFQMEINRVISKGGVFDPNAHPDWFKTSIAGIERDFEAARIWQNNSEYFNSPQSLDEEWRTLPISRPV